MSSQENKILSRLNSISEEVNFIRNNMVHKDEIMSLEEFEAYKRSLDSNNLVSYEEVKKSLKL